VMNVVVLYRNTWLLEIREYDATTRRVTNFKAVDGDVGIRGLSSSTRAYDAIGSCGSAVNDRPIAATVIAEGDGVALGPMHV
jgi:hypothetical protein